MQDQPFYGAERRGAPISAFITISDRPILTRGIIFNPFFTIIADDSLLHQNYDAYSENAASDIAEMSTPAKMQKFE